MGRLTLRRLLRTALVLDHSELEVREVAYAPNGAMLISWCVRSVSGQGGVVLLWNLLDGSAKPSRLHHEDTHICHVSWSSTSPEVLSQITERIPILEGMHNNRPGNRSAAGVVSGCIVARSQSGAIFAIPQSTCGQTFRVFHDMFGVASRLGESRTGLNPGQSCSQSTREFAWHSTCFMMQNDHS